MKFIYIILMVITQTLTDLETWNIIETKNRTVNLNELVDRFNPSFTQFISKHGLDPLKLSQAVQKLSMENPDFSESTMYKLDLVLHSGVLKGLSDLRRHNNATLIYADKLLKMDIGFEFKRLQGTYDYILKLIVGSLKGYIIATAENVRAVINITFNTTNYILALKKFDLQVPGRITVTVKNKNGSVDWINTAIVNIVAPFFKNTITSAVREEASNAIWTYFNEINHKIAPRKTFAHILKYQLLNQNLMSGYQNLIL